MKIGDEITWIDGLNFAPGRGRSYFLKCVREELYFVIFTEEQNVWDAGLYVVNQKDYSEFEKKKYVKKSEEEKKLPPWFPQGVGFAWAYARMSKYASSQSIAEERKNKIRKACQTTNAWLNDCYYSNLNRLAVEEGCNTKRFRLWVFTFLAFGPEIAVLQPPNWNNGKYDRMSTERKLGRKSRVGNYFNHNLSDTDKENFRSGYASFKGLKKNQMQIYDEILLHKYKVRTKDICKYKNGAKIIRIDGVGTVPSINQFRYWLKMNIGLEKVYSDRFGYEKARSKVLRDKGSYSEDDMNLMGVVERDAYVHDEIPRGIVEKQLPKLWVVHLLCRLSSLIVGIGFSHGGEKAEAYRMAEFCAAIDKTEYCRLMGITEFDPESWPSVGISAETITDRGPGSAENIGSIFATLTPSYSPQSKPLVEASNPKKDRVSGGPVYRLSNMTPVELMRHAIRNAIAANDSKNVVEKFPNRFLDDDQLCTPATLWKKFESVGRNAAIQLSFDTAVRTYLNKDKATLGDIGVNFLGQRYFSPKIDQVVTIANTSAEVTIYYMPMVLRQIWVEGKEGLVELSAVMMILDDDEQLFVTHKELEAFDERKKRSHIIGMNHKIAVNAERNGVTYQEMGRGVSPNNVKRGRPNNKSKSAKNEMKILRGGR